MNFIAPKSIIDECVAKCGESCLAPIRFILGMKKGIRPRNSLLQKIKRSFLTCIGGGVVDKSYVFFAVFKCAWLHVGKNGGDFILCQTFKRVFNSRYGSDKTVNPSVYRVTYAFARYVEACAHEFDISWR